MTEGVHATRPHDEVQAGGKQHGDQDVDAKHRQIGKGAGDQWHTREHHNQPDPGIAHGRCRGSQCKFRWGGATRLGPRLAEQTPGPQHQYQRHHQKLDHQRQLRKRNRPLTDRDRADRITDSLDLGDQQGGQIGARDAAHAAHHHHHEGLTDRDEIQPEIGGLPRNLQCAAQTGQHRAEREHAGEQPCFTHTECSHHLAILCGRANQHAKTGPFQQQPQRQQHRRADHHQQQVIDRQPGAQKIVGTLEPRGLRPEQVLGTPAPEHDITGDQCHCKGGQQLKQLGGAIDPPEHQHLDQRTDHCTQQRSACHPRPETETAVRPENLDQGVGQIDPDHVERAMRKIDDTAHTEDQRQAGSDHEEGRRTRQPVDQRNRKGLQRQRRTCFRAMNTSATSSRPTVPGSGIVVGGTGAKGKSGRSDGPGACEAPEDSSAVLSRVNCHTGATGQNARSSPRGKPGPLDLGAGSAGVDAGVGVGVGVKTGACRAAASSEASPRGGRDIDSFRTAVGAAGSLGQSTGMRACVGWATGAGRSLGFGFGRATAGPEAAVTGAARGGGCFLTFGAVGRLLGFIALAVAGGSMKQSSAAASPVSITVVRKKADRTDRSPQ